MPCLFLAVQSQVFADAPTPRSQGVEDFFARAMRITPEEFGPMGEGLYQETIGSREAQAGVTTKAQLESALSELAALSGTTLASNHSKKPLKPGARGRWFAKAPSKPTKKTLARGLAAAGDPVSFAPCEGLPATVQPYCERWIVGQSATWVQTQVGEILNREYTDGVRASGALTDPGDPRETDSSTAVEQRSGSWRDTIQDRDQFSVHLPALVSRELAVFGPVSDGASPGVYGARERAILRGLDRARVLRFAVKEVLASWWMPALNAATGAPSKKFQIRSQGCQGLANDWTTRLRDVLPTVNGMPGTAWDRFPDPQICTQSSPGEVAAEDCAVKTLLSEALIQQPANILLCEVLERAHSAREKVLRSVATLRPLIGALIQDNHCDRCTALGEAHEFSACLQSCYQVRSEDFLVKTLPTRLLQEFPDLARLDANWNRIKANFPNNFWVHARLR